MSKNQCLPRNRTRVLPVLASCGLSLALIGCGSDSESPEATTGESRALGAGSEPAQAQRPEAPALAEAPAAAGETAAAGATEKGKEVYDSTCITCHREGIGGAPKLADKSAWGPRIAQGSDTLYKHAIEGFQGATGMMPPKGGNTSLPDAEVKAAVDYMVGQAE